MIKKLVIAVIIIDIVAIVIAFCGCNIQPATKNDIEELRAEFNQRLDSINNSIETLKADADTLKSDTKRLKAGQEVIYGEVKKGNETFSDKLAKFFKF